VGLLGIGAGAVVAPRTMAKTFGVPVEDGAALTYLRAACVRDAIVGALLLAVLDDDAARRRALALSSLIGLADAIVIAAGHGIRPSHALHASGFLAVAALALTDRP